MVYNIGDELSCEKITLKNGKYEAVHDMYVYYENKYVWDDFNNDGLKDAAVIISESGGGSGTWPELAFLINDGKNLVHQYSYGFGDRTNILSLKENNGEVVVEMYERQKGDCLSNPTKYVRKAFKYPGPFKWGKSRDEILNPGRYNDSK
jgi:hypothetical protein